MANDNCESGTVTLQAFGFSLSITFWVTNTDFVCQYLYMIQGGGFFWKSSIKGYLTSYMANIIIRSLEIDNQNAYPALRFSTGNLRTFDGGIYIKRNTNSGAINHSAIYVETAQFATVGTITGDTNTGYDHFIDARSSLVTLDEEWLTAWNELGNARNCQFASLTTRVIANNIIPAS